MSDTVTVPPPADGLRSNSNYAIDEGGQQLAGLSVTIDVTQGITCQSATGSTLGFTFQLNAYSDETQSAWQQYVAKVDGNQLELHINNWAATGTQPALQPFINSAFPLCSIPQGALQAGYTITISLLSDQSNNIDGVTCLVVNQGTTVADLTENLVGLPDLNGGTVTQSNLAPINAFEMLLVGPGGGSNAVLSSGAGMLSYTATNDLTVSQSLPSGLAYSNGTAETANSVYEPLSAGPASPITQTFTVAPQPVLVNFDSITAAGTLSSLIVDANGNLLGAISAGGANGDGAVYEIANTATGYATTPSTLVSFDGTDGASPMASLTADANGDLFGTTSAGGTNGHGTLYEVTNAATGYATTPTTLVNFGSTDIPSDAGLITDANGDLFGTTSHNNASTIFQLVNTATGYASTLTPLATINGSLVGDLVIDANGDLFGTTPVDGDHNSGTVFELVNTVTGYASAPTTLVSFDTNNANPNARLIIDANGNLFGATSAGGGFGNGALFEIANTTTGYASTPLKLLGFNSTDGGFAGGLINDANGDLFFTVSQGGSGATLYDGSVQELANTATGYSDHAITVAAFNGSNGQTPFNDLAADANGDLFAMASRGGANGHGTVVEITHSGFVIACFAAGTRIATPSGEVPVEHLKPGDWVVCASGTDQRIVWIGYRRLDIARHKRPDKLLPIRIMPGALDDGIPNRPLFLSPDHAVFVDDVLIPVKFLCNGRTIVQVPADRVTYYHIELPRHDVVFAEGLPTESYLDTGNRSSFANSGGSVALHPDFASRVWDSKGCAPLVVTGAQLDAVRRRVEERAAYGCVCGPAAGTEGDAGGSGVFAELRAEAG
jgi:hypothetical protein